MDISRCDFPGCRNESVVFYRDTYQSCSFNLVTELQAEEQYEGSVHVCDQHNNLADRRTAIASLATETRTTNLSDAKFTKDIGIKL